MRSPPQSPESPNGSLSKLILDVDGAGFDSVLAKGEERAEWEMTGPFVCGGAEPRRSGVAIGATPLIPLCKSEAASC